MHMDAAIQEAVDAWLSEPAIADALKEEIRRLVSAGADNELTDRFYQPLAFGTGGLRALLGAGLNRVNVYTVGLAAQGLANYVARQGDAAKAGGVAIAYDCRRMSEELALRTALVMAGNGIKAYLFEKLRPTPELSFAIRHLGCTAGVVVTASHNPPEYNGFKAYWSDGGQIVPPHDTAIIEEVDKVGGFGNVKALEVEEARQAGLLQDIGVAADEAFLEEVDASCLNPQICRSHGQKLKIVFTSLHGTGGQLIPEALRRRGFEQVLEVPEQAEPDGEFSTVDSPNPEEAAALDLAIVLAKKEGADVVIGTDPDADRMGIAVRRGDGEFELVTGNRIGSLICYYICEQLAQAQKFPENAVVLSTIVSGDMMKEIARSYGAEVVETLTGFKWIGAKIRQYEKEGSPDNPSKRFIFGAEESYGYLPGTFARDKDAVTSAAFIAEAAAWAASKGKSLLDMLDDLFARFGYYHESAKSVVLKGKEGGEQIKAIMERLRHNPPDHIGGQPVVAVADMMTGEKRDAQTGQVLEQYDLPAANVVLFTLAEGGKVIARPSGTEPKIKFYILLKTAGDDLDRAAEQTTAQQNLIVEDVENWTQC